MTFTHIQNPSRLKATFTPFQPACLTLSLNNVMSIKLIESRFANEVYMFETLHFARKSIFEFFFVTLRGIKK